MDEPKNISKEGLLKEASEAARRGDAVGMVRCLFASQVVDRLAWKVSRDFVGKLSPEGARDCIAEAIADCYAALAGGKLITSLVGYLLKSARNVAIDTVAKFQTVSADGLENITDTSDPEGDAARDAVRTALRREALRLARSLLPQLGQENVQSVMEVIFDAVEQDVVDLTDQRIAEITGLQAETVRRLKNRGFERLRRVAAENGFHLTTYSRAVGSSNPWDTNNDTGFNDIGRGSEKDD